MPATLAPLCVWKREPEFCPATATKNAGWLAIPGMAIRTFVGRLGEVRKASPQWLFWLLCCEYLVLLFLAIWVPGNDYDSMTSYVTRIKLAEFGPLRQTGTMEIQYLFPTFFDFLHAPFLRAGWFTAFPNFALFTISLITAICLFEPRVAARWVLGLAAAAPVLVTVTALKNDISLALLAFLGWAILFYMRPSAWYPACALTAIAALIGTKWHGFFVAPPLFLCLVWRIWRERSILANWRTAAVLLVACPVLWWVSSAQVYLDNLRHEGELCPKVDFIANKPDTLRNIKAFTVNTALETAELPLYEIDKRWMHGDLWLKVKKWSDNSKAYGYLVAPHSQLAAFGLPMLLMIIGCIGALFNRNVPGPFRASGAIALLYLAACLKVFHYDDWTNRYFLVTYVLGLAPSAYLLSRWRTPRLIRWAAWFWVLMVGYQSLVWNFEKPLVARQIFYAEERKMREFSSIWPEIRDGQRERLYFKVWGGHFLINQYLVENVRSRDHLLIVNRYRGNYVPFLYPHIKDRKATYTAIINDRFNQSPPPGFENRFEWIMVHNGDFNHPRYRETYRFSDVIFYRRVPLEDPLAESLP